MQRPNCGCSEAEYVLKDGTVIRPKNSPHDCDYVELRNSLIPKASAIAVEKCAGITGPLFSATYSRIFSAEMEHAYREYSRGHK